MSFIKVWLALCMLSVAGFGTAAGFSTTIRMHDGSPVADVVVVAIPAVPLKRPPPATPETVEQIGLEFVPQVKPVYVGTTVRFPNNDKGRHHVYSFSAAKRFELPLYAPGASAAPVLFDAPGVVVVGCNIHDWMIGYIYVSESPFFAKSNLEGKARLADMPPGRYTLRIWHPLQEGTEAATAKVVQLDATGDAEVAWEIKLKPDLRPKRKPAAANTASAAGVHHH
jgi:plastocyanin